MSGKKFLIISLTLLFATNVFGWKEELLSGSNVGAELVFSTDGSYEWAWDNTNKRLKSSNNGIDSSTSSSIISFSTNAQSTLSFNYGVSSESNFDKLSITLDGTNIVDHISGIVSNRYTGTLPQGDHKLVVSYTKDSSQSNNEDLAYISDLWCAVYSGTTGDLEWRVNGENLIISGAGAMASSYYIDFYNNENHLAPWYCFRKVIKNLTISNRCTRITDFAFAGMSNINSIIIPASVNSIGTCAFYGCNPTTLRFEDSDEQLGISPWVDGCPDNDWSYCPTYAFGGAENIYLGRNVSVGGFNASSLNYKIKNLQIGNKVTEASILSLITSSSCNVVLDSNNPYLTIVDDVLYDTNKTILYKVLPKKTGAVIVPATVTSICSYAAESNQHITSLHIGGSVDISDYAFLGCTNLKYVDVGSSIKSVGNYAFSYYNDSDEDYYDITGITFNFHDLRGYCESVNCSASAVNMIANQSLAECIADELIIPEGTTRIAASRFDGFSGIKSVIFPNTLQSVESMAFHDCTGLTTITLPNGLTNLGYSSFGSCNLKTVYSYPIEVPTTSSDPFLGTNIETATLYVPSQSVEKYRIATYWKGFGTICAFDAPVPEDPSEDPSIDSSDDIEPSTDVSNYTIALYFNDVEHRAGDFNLALNMKCAEENITAFQCIVSLPEGVNWKSTTDKRGNVVYNLPAWNEDRTDASYHTLNPIVKNQDGTYSIIVYSMQKDYILDLDGALLTLPLEISEEMEAGEYNIMIKNIVLVDVNGNQTQIEKVVSRLTIPSYKTGDANGDEIINVADIVSVISSILGEPDANFIFAAADVNGDNVINVADIVGIIDIILNANSGENLARLRSMKAKLLAPAVQNSNLQILPFIATEGTKSVTAKLNMNNPGEEFTALQCEVEFPEGIAWASTVDRRGNVKYTAPTFDAEADRTDATYHTVEIGKNTAGNINIFVYSMQKEIILEEEGAVLDIPLAIDENLAPGVYDVKIKNIVLSRTNSTYVEPADYTFSVMVGLPTEKNLQLHGNYTAEVIADFNSVLGSNTTVTSVDFSEAFDVNASTEITLGNKNSIIYVAEGNTIANTNNVVIGEECSNLVLTNGYSFSAPKAFVAANASYDAVVSSSLGYKTLVLPYDCTVPAGFEAYEVGSVTDGTLDMVPVNTITANKPVILKNAGTATLSANNVEIVPTEGALIDGVLVGTYEAIEAPVGSFVLQNHGGNVAFYHVTEAVQPVVGAFRAYLSTPSNEARIRVVFDGEATGIRQTENGELKVDNYYNLNGQRVSKFAKGVVINNGHKIVK